MDVASDSRSRANSFSLSGSGEITKMPQQSHFQPGITYQNLCRYAQPGGVVSSEQNNQFFVITHPTKVNSFTSPAPYLGWKLHLSVNFSDLEKAFNLAVPIISRYRLCFKVVNSTEIADERFIRGSQMVIYLEEEEKPAVTEQEVGEMMEEIHRTFLLNGIKPGIKPDSDAKTLSSFFSIRNDKCKPLLNRSLVGYVPAHVAGRHFNPSNNVNPFDSLLREEQKPFDPMAHFWSFGLMAHDENSYYRLIDTMKACINEYTYFETLTNESKETFILQYCRETGNDNAEFFKEAYKKNPEIMQAVKHVFTIVFLFEADFSVSKSWYFEYVDTAQLSKHYADGNPFKKLLESVEYHAKKQIERHQFIQLERTFSLLDLYLKTKLIQSSKMTFPQTTSAMYAQLLNGIK